MTTTCMLPADAPVALRAVWTPMLAGDLSIEDVRTALCAVMGDRHTNRSIQVVNYVVRIDFSNRVEDFRECLERVGPLGLSIAPELVALYETSHYAALVSRYSAVPGESLRPVDQDDRLTPAVKQRFRDDVARLFDAGLNHPFAARGWQCWLLSELTHTVVMGGWHALRFEPPRNADRELAQLDKFLTIF